MINADYLEPKFDTNLLKHSVGFPTIKILPPQNVMDYLNFHPEKEVVYFYFPIIRLFIKMLNVTSYQFFICAQSVDITRSRSGVIPRMGIPKQISVCCG